MSFLKNGGWYGIGSFATIKFDGEIGGQRVQVVGQTHQLDQNGHRRSREYFCLRSSDEVVEMPTSVKSVKSAKEWAMKRVVAVS